MSKITNKYPDDRSIADGVIVRLKSHVPGVAGQDGIICNCVNNGEMKQFDVRLISGGLLEDFCCEDVMILSSE